MGHRGLDLAHPFSKPPGTSDVVSTRDKQTCAQEEGSKDWRVSTLMTGKTVSLDRVMSNSTQHCKTVIFRERKRLGHPWEVVSEAKMSASDSLRNPLTSAGETERGSAIGTNNDLRGLRLQAHLANENMILHVATE